MLNICYACFLTGGKEQTSKSNDTAEEQSPTMSTEEAEAEAEPPKVPAIPYTDIRAAFEGNLVYVS